MDPKVLVDDQIEDARRIARILVEKGWDVTAICWGKSGEPAWWTLYVATPSVELLGLDGCYLELHYIFAANPEMRETLDSLRFIGATSPFARDLVLLRKPYLRGRLQRERSILVGSDYLEKVLIYPEGVGNPGSLGGRPLRITVSGPGENLVVTPTDNESATVSVLDH